MLEQVREAEIVQAIDRVRPVFNRRRIIVLTNMALDLTVDHTLTWVSCGPANSLSRSLGMVCCRSVRLTFAAVSLTFGDPRNGQVGPSPQHSKKGCNPQIIYLFGVWPH